MGHRKLREVECASPCDRPGCIPRSRRARGSAARGITYEKNLASALRKSWPSVIYGQWFSYKADGQTGFCQTDFLHLGHSTIHVIECKLTNVEEATEQLFDLYFPVLRRAFLGRTVRGIIATRSVHRAPLCALVVPTLAEALAVCDVRVPILHWIGRGAI